MRQKITWIAEDGTEFEGPNANSQCWEYEKKQAENKYSALSKYIKFFNRDGSSVPYLFAKEVSYSIHYAKVYDIPDDEEVPEICDLWCEVVPEKLQDKISSFGCGWYVGDGLGSFEWWDNVIDTFNCQAAMITKLSQGN